MSAKTGLLMNAGKSRLLTTMCAGAIALSASLSANAAFVFSGGSTQALPVAQNDFNGNLQGLGFDQMTTGAQLKVDMDGSVMFYYIAAESGFTNSFYSGSSFATENNDSFKWDGWAGFSIDVKAGDVLDFSFTSATASALTPVDNASGTNLDGLGIMTRGEDAGSELVLAYNDNPHTSGTGMDADYDDMLVRAEFSAVPVPAAVWLFGSGLLGLIAAARRKA